MFQQDLNTLKIKVLTAKRVLGKMKVPDSFRPEMDLGEKTLQLIEGPILKGPMQVTRTLEQEEKLKDIIYELHNYSWYEPDSPTHSEIESLLEESGYTKIKDKNLSYEYWCKTRSINSINSYNIDILIRRLDYKGNMRYDFASVGKNRLEEFCKRFERYHHLAEFSDGRDNRFVKIMTKVQLASPFAGGAGGYAALTSYAAAPMWTTKFLLAAGSGLFVGAFAGIILFTLGIGATAYLIDKQKDKVEKKADDCCEELITYKDSKAIIRAFN